MEKVFLLLKKKIQFMPKRILALILSLLIVGMSIPTIYYTKKAIENNDSENNKKVNNNSSLNSSTPKVDSMSSDDANGEALSKDLSTYSNISSNEDVNALVEKALDQLSKNNYQDAIKSLNAAIRLENSNAKLFFLRAKIYEAFGKTNLAILDYEEAIKLDSSLVDAYVALADLYYDNESQNDALKICNDGLALQPDNTELIETRMYIYSDSGEYEKAIADAESLIKLKPTDPLGYAGLADFLVTYNEYDKVIKNYTTALKYCTDKDKELMYAIYRQRSLCYYNTDKYKEAISDFKIYYDACEYDTNIIYFALSYYYTNDNDNAITWFKRCINNSVEVNMASYYLASIYAVKKEYNSALDYYTTCINGDYNKDNSLYNRGVCYKELNNKEKALADFNTCIQVTNDLALKQTVETAIQELNK